MTTFQIRVPQSYRRMCRSVLRFFLFLWCCYTCLVWFSRGPFSPVFCPFVRFSPFFRYPVSKTDLPVSKRNPETRWILFWILRYPTQVSRRVFVADVDGRVPRPTFWILVGYLGIQRYPTNFFPVNNQPDSIRICESK